MKATAHDRRATRAYTARLNIARWWYSRGPWTHIFILAGLVCTFELVAMWAAYPWLLEQVSA